MMIIASLPVVAQIAREYSRSEQGIVVARYHRIFSVHAGPSGQHQDFVFDGVYVNGTLVRVRMLRYTIGGSTASASQVASVVSSYDHPKPGDVLAPWDPRYVRQYRDIRRGSRSILFTTLFTTYGHGNGSFAFDGSDNVTTYSYPPTVMPQHATNGRVQGRRGPVLAGYWAMTSELQTYTGHYSLFAASASASITQSAFRRFSTLQAALDFIARDRL